MVNSIDSESDSVVLIDSGNFLSARPSDFEFKSELMLSAFKSIKYNAIGIGGNEFNLGVEKLKPLSEKYGIPFVASNLRIKPTGQPLVNPYVILNAGSLSVAVFSIVPESIARYSPALLEHLEITNPVKAVSDLLSELKDKVDVTILMTDLNIESSKNLVSSLPGIDIIISNEVSKKALTPGVENPNQTLVVPGCQKGSSLGLLKLFLEADGNVTVSESEMIQLDDDVSSDPDMTDIINVAYAGKADQQRLEQQLDRLEEELKEYRDLSPMEYLNKINEQ